MSERVGGGKCKCKCSPGARQSRQASKQEQKEGARRCGESVACPGRRRYLGCLNLGVRTVVPADLLLSARWTVVHLEQWGTFHAEQVKWLWLRGSWLVDAVAIVAASRLRNWRRGNEGRTRRTRSMEVNENTASSTNSGSKFTTPQAAFSSQHS